MLFCTRIRTRSEKTTHQGAEEQPAVPTVSGANPHIVVPTGKRAPPAAMGCVPTARGAASEEKENSNTQPAWAISSTGWELSVQCAIQW